MRTQGWRNRSSRALAVAASPADWRGNARLLLLAMGLLAALLARPARADDSQIIWPEVGFGAGQSVGTHGAVPVYQLDLSMGFESRGGMMAKGGLLRVDFMMMPDMQRMDFGPLFTSSLGFDNGGPFLRTGIGPIMTYTEAPNYTAIGLGGLAEVSIGLKSLAELYVDGRLTFDPADAAFAVTAGVRVNALLLDLCTGRRFYGGRWRW